MRTRSLPYRQLRKLYSANEVDVDGSLPYRLLRNSYLTNCCSSAGSLSNRQIKCEKSSYFRTRFSLNMTVRGGLTRFARPAGSPLTVFVVCPTGCASCRTPVGASHPPWSALCEKKLALSYELFFKYGGEGGIDSLRSPCGQPTHCVRGLSNWLRQLSNPGRGFSPPLECIMRKKARTFVRALL